MDVRKVVREKYGKIALNAGNGQAASCCSSGAGCCGSDAGVSISDVKLIYETDALDTLPESVTQMSLGCGDPITLAALQPGDTVLDLGSGGGIDCFMAAKKVGATGRVIGVDMTPEMLEKARANKATLGAENVEFRLGEIEHLPVADGVVDVIISNCVINLSPDKPQVFREALRVLKPGGKLAVSDIVTQGALPAEIKQNLEAWVGCVAGAWDVADIVAALKDAGFINIDVVPVYLPKEMVDSALQQMKFTPTDAQVDPYKAIFSAKISAFKPR